MRWQSCWLYRIEFRVLYGSLCLLLPSASLRKTIVLWFSLLFQLVSMRYSHTYRRLKAPDWESIVLLWCFWEISHLSEPGIVFCYYIMLIILGRSHFGFCFSRYFSYPFSRVQPGSLFLALLLLLQVSLFWFIMCLVTQLLVTLVPLTSSLCGEVRHGSLLRPWPDVFHDLVI